MAFNFMHTRSGLLMYLILFVSCSSPQVAQNQTANTVITSTAVKLNPRDIAIFAVIDVDESGNESLECAVFGDGATFLQSPEQKCLFGKINDSRLSMLRKIIKQTVEHMDEVSVRYVLPDGSYTKLVIRTSERGRIRYRELSSFHDGSETPGKSMASQHGLHALQGRPASSIEAKWSQKYREFRSDWQKLRDVEPKQLDFIFNYVPSIELRDVMMSP